MNLKKSVLFILFVLAGLFILEAQEKDNYKQGDNTRDTGSKIEGDWSFGLGLNLVDDGGVTLGGLSDAKKYGHFHFPITFNIEYFYNSQFSFSSFISFNKYVEGKIVDRRGVILKDEEPNYFSFDLATKFYFRDIFSDYIFEPYLSLGLGYTKIGDHKVIAFSSEIPQGVAIDGNGNWDIPTIGNLTINAGIGVNYWFSKNFGIYLSAVAKWGVPSNKYKDIISNQTQFSFGGFYCLKR